MKMYLVRDVHVGSFPIWEICECYEQVAYSFVYFLPLFRIFLGRVANQA